MFEKFKEAVNKKNIKNYILLIRFDHTTTDGDFIKEYTLLYNDGEDVINTSYLLKNIKGIKQNKKGRFTSGGQLDGYLAYYMRELKQVII